MNSQIQDKLVKHFQASPVRRYPKGTMITVANHAPEGVSLLISGVVEQYEITPGGNKVTINIFKPPAFFPMSWAINKTPNPYFFGALTAVELKLADADETVAFVQANPDVMFDLLSRVYRGVDAILRRLVLAASGIAANRLIFELLIEAYRFGSDTDDTHSTLAVKQSVLADRSGLARETVSREMHKLEQKNLISRTKQGIIIDIKRLEHELDTEV